MNWLTTEINKHLNENWSVLDLCCGHGAVADGFLFRSYVGVDIVQKYLDMSTMKDDSRVELICQNIFDFCDTHDQTYDVVMAIDAIEHFEYDDGALLVDWMEAHSNKRVIVFTPENTINTPTCNDVEGVWGTTEGDIYQRHLSMFRREFFMSRGYKVYQLYRNNNCFTGIPYCEMLYVLNK